MLASLFNVSTIIIAFALLSSLSYVILLKMSQVRQVRLECLRLPTFISLLVTNVKVSQALVLKFSSQANSKTQVAFSLLSETLFANSQHQV